MRASERSRLHFVEAQAKRYKWRSVALVGVNDTALARQFLAHFPRCKVLVVPIWREDLRPGPAGAQRNYQRNLRLWTKAYSGRFECEPGGAMKFAGSTERQFDGVVLWTGIAPELLAVIGGAWVPRVVDGGWLLGVDHRLALVRGVLNQVAPGWVQYREGIWGVRVRRSADVEHASGLPESPADEADGVACESAATSGSSDEPIPALPVGGCETHAVSSDADAANIAQPSATPKRRGGRPKGSKNKPKDVAA